MGIVDVALTQVGIKETGLNNVKYNTWYYGFAESNGKKPWCAVFVSWCADQAGCLSAIGGKTASVSTLRDNFIAAGKYKKKGSGYIPKAGDIMIQKDSGASHTGIVYDCNGSTFYTIEGNASDQVKKCSYSLNDSKLSGFGTPTYDGTPLSGNVPSIDDGNTGNGTPSGGSLGVGSYDYTKYTVKSGDTIESIAKKFGCTVAMIIFLNNLETPDLKAGQVLQVPTIKNKDFDPISGVEPITKKHTTGVVVSHPTIEVEFYGEYGRLAAVSTTEVAKDTDFDSEIISVNTIRNMGQDCPTFNMSLVWRNNWYENLSSNDLLVIKMQRPPESKATVFLGLIDDIRKNTDFSSGQPQRAIQITGRGFAKAFVNFDVGLIENISIDTGTGFFAGLTQLVGCNSYDAIKIVLDSYVGSAIKYSFGNGKSYDDYFVYSGNPHDYEKLVDYTSYTSYNGNLWNFIKNLGNAPFNETYWEIESGKPHLIHRRTPFNKQDWIKLDRITIKDLDIVSDNTGRSDLETYTVFAVQLALGDETMTNLYNPLWYPPFYSKYGISQLSVLTPYQIWSDDTDEAVAGFFQELFNYNIKNNIFSNGTIVVKGSNQYKVGQRVIIESENMEYYVESVSHNFNCYGTWTTSLGVTRGIQPENRFTAPWGCAEEFTPAVANAIVQQTAGTNIDWSNLPEVTYPENNGGNNPVNGGSVTGNTITLPSGLGTIYTYMGWQCITSKTSTQYKLREEAGQKFDSQGFGIITCPPEASPRYVIACTTTYGKVGDKLTAYLANGQTIRCIIGDIKNQNDSGCNKWGHQNGASVLEFVVDKSSWYGTSKTVVGYHPEWKGTTTTRIVNEGSYW